MDNDKIGHLDTVDALWFRFTGIFLLGTFIWSDRNGLAFENRPHFSGESPSELKGYGWEMLSSDGENTKNVVRFGYERAGSFQGDFTSVSTVERLAVHWKAFIRAPVTCWLLLIQSCKTDSSTSLSKQASTKKPNSLSVSSSSIHKSKASPTP